MTKQQILAKDPKREELPYTFKTRKSKATLQIV
jgi:hypothetical protein